MPGIYDRCVVSKCEYNRIIRDCDYYSRLASLFYVFVYEHGIYNELLSYRVRVSLVDNIFLFIFITRIVCVCIRFILRILIQLLCPCNSYQKHCSGSCRHYNHCYGTKQWYIFGRNPQRQFVNNRILCRNNGMVLTFCCV